MNVEHKTARTAQAGAADGRFGKPKASGAGEAAGAGGFMSVLMSLGAPDGAEESLTLASMDEPAVDDGKMQGLLDPGLPTPAQQAPDVAQLLQQQGGQQVSDAAQLLQQQGGQQVSDVAQLLQQQGGQQVSAPAPMLPGRPEGATAATAAVGALSAAQSPAQNGLMKPAPEAGEAGFLPLRKTGAASSKAAAALSSRPGQESPLGGRPDAAGAAGHAAAQATHVVSAATSGVLAELMAASTPGGDALRQSVRLADRNNGALVTSVPEGGWGAPAFQPGVGALDVSTVSASVSGAAPEAAIAEQVYYWMSNDVQNAELKLDNWGQSPVEVSISLQGNEAQVEFRTDVQEIRQILERASAQLKDMLQGEGLVLTGVSVGSSGTGGAGAREQSPRPDARRATVTLPETAALDRPRRMGDSTGRSVDVFV